MAHTKDIVDGYADKYQTIYSFYTENESEITELQTSIEHQSTICMIQTELANGERCLTKGIYEAESMDMDLVYDALDAFNLAGRLALKHKDTELEAISEANLGNLWCKALKNDKRAKVHLYNCVRVANTLFPRNVQSMPWFNRASSQLQEIRDRIAAADREKEKEEEKKYLDLVDDDLKAVKTARDKSEKDLLEHLNSKFLSDDPISMDGETEPKIKNRKLYLKFIVRFHPDKHQQKPGQILFLNSEITKILTGIYKAV